MPISCFVEMGEAVGFLVPGLSTLNRYNLAPIHDCTLDDWVRSQKMLEAKGLEETLVLKLYEVRLNFEPD